MNKLVRKILKVFADNKLWDSGVELIGSWCFLLYQKHFGVKSFPLRTVDIDFLIPFPYKAAKKIDLVALLEPLGFRMNFKPDGSIFLWNAHLKIEFITAERGRGSDKAKEIKNLSVSAVPLRFVDILFENPVVVKDEGIDIKVPNPAAFALHKIIISERRKKPDKKQKDLEQALLVIEAIGLKQVKDIYLSCPKAWQNKALDVLRKEAKFLPLRKELIETIINTLQNS